MTQKWSTEFKEKIRNSRVGTTKILATAIQNTKAKVFICISGVAGYKPHALKEYTEESQSESYDFLSSRIFIFYQELWNL
jgi:NAD dependent epimerase/dehydratase family enzyme